MSQSPHLLRKGMWVFILGGLTLLAGLGTWFFFMPPQSTPRVEPPVVQLPVPSLSEDDRKKIMSQAQDLKRALTDESGRPRSQSLPPSSDSSSLEASLKRFLNCVLSQVNDLAGKEEDERRWKRSLNALTCDNTPMDRECHDLEGKAGKVMEGYQELLKSSLEELGKKQPLIDALVAFNKAQNFLTELKALPREEPCPK